MSAPSSEQIQDSKRGILLILTAMALYVVNDSLVKLVTKHYSVEQILVVRGVFAITFMMALILRSGHLNKLRESLDKLILIRAILEALTAISFIIALSHLPIADLTVLMQMTSIIIVVLTALTGMNSIQPPVWIAVVIGFCGVLFMVKPGTSEFSIYTLIGLLTTFFVASRDLITRKINPAIPTVIVSLTTTVSVVVIGLLPGTSNWAPLEWRETLYLLAAALFVTIGNLCAVKAHRIASPSLLAPFRYSVLIWAFLSGFVIFGDWPDLLSVIGAALIVSAGLYTLHNAQKKA
jgi:drug/metabolite transporter (DMT)-like permease